MVGNAEDNKIKLTTTIISCYENEREYKLYSINFPRPKIVSSNKMENIIINGDQYFFLHYYSMEGKTDERQNTDTHELDQLMGEHNDIIQNHPHGILPPCSMDHIIELMLW